MRWIALIGICVIFPTKAIADTLIPFADGSITWEATGVLDYSFGDPYRPEVPRPAVGTPYVLSLTFNPSTAKPPVFAVNPKCSWVTVVGSLTLGGYTYSATGDGYTHARLLGSNCERDEAFTQFALANEWAAEGDDPWNLSGAAMFVIASYTDLLEKDGFPVEPTGQGWLALQFQPGLAGAVWEAGGTFAPRLVDQPTVIPEPSTLILFGTGLAAAARRIGNRAR